MRSLLLAAALLMSPLTHAQSCEPVEAPILSVFDGQAVPVGTVIGHATVSTDIDSFNIDITTDDIALPADQGWELYALHLFVSAAESTPPNDEGVLLPGSYPYTLTGISSRTFHFEQPLEAIDGIDGARCGTSLAVSIFLNFRIFDSDTLIIRANSNGSVQAPGSMSAPVSDDPLDGVGYWFTHDVCCAETGCTHSPGRYKTHSAFSKPAQRDPWPISENTPICGLTWHGALNTKSPDTWYKLASQWIAAMLNVASGASSMPEVDQALSDGEVLLNNTCRTIPKSLKADATPLQNTLSDYNRGAIGPGACSAP